MNVYEKLNEARERFHGQELKKSGRNTFANYNYFELGDFLVPALKVFKEVGLCAVVSFDAGIATMVIRNIEKPDDAIVLTSPMGSAALKGCHEVQNIGAVETYQRRYLWVAALEIVEHDALEPTTGSDVVAKAPRSRSPSTMNEVDNLDDPDRLLYLTTLASTLVVQVDKNEVSEAYERLVREKLDDTDYIVLWDILKQKAKPYVRTKLKAHGEALKATRKAAEGATA